MSMNLSSPASQQPECNTADAGTVSGPSGEPSTFLGRNDAMLVPTVARWRETLSGAENQVVVVMIPRKPGHKEIFRHLALLVACVIAGAADANGPELQLAVTDPRPVALAIAVLSERHGIAITYEDPRYEFEGDLKDVTSEVARSPIKPGQRILVPLGGALGLTYSIS